MIHPSCLGYTVVFADEAKKDLRRLETKIIEKILEKTEDLVSSKLDSLNIKKLKSKTQLYRLRVGDYRVVYSIDHDQIIIHVVAIGHRKDIYQNLDKRLENNN